MQYKLLSVNTPADIINIGDYIQALAANQFLPRNDGFVSREALNLYNDKECLVIMNGWFMHNPKNWPPSNKIKPIFVAFHINSLTKGEMLTSEGQDYFKKYEPIGCRDYNTCEQLSHVGIRNYFTGCLTLTLGMKYRCSEKDGKVYFVDPYFKCRWSKIDLLKNLPFYFVNKNGIDILSTKIHNGQNGLKKKIRLVDFYKEYSRFFTKETIRDAIFITQMDVRYNKDFHSDEELLREAERLVKLYAHASLVVTSRIHCALPCLGLETPVIYVENSSQDEISSCRLKGLRELLNVMEWEEGELIPKFKFEGKMSPHNPPTNKTDWKTLAKAMEINLFKIIGNADV